MKVTALVENTAAKSMCGAEHGLSLYVETDRHRILFDSGQSGLFAQNARLLGVDLSKVDIAFLSHGHFDHAGGLIEFLKCNDTAKIYMNRRAFRPRYNAAQKYIGLDAALKNSSRVVLVDDELKIDDQLTLRTYNDRPNLYPVQSFGLTEEKDGVCCNDPFRHEQYLILTENGKKVLLSGCSHKGIGNLMHWAEAERVQVMIGGFHFMRIEPEQYAQLDTAAQELLSYPTEYYTCHCTGLEQYAYLKTKMGDRLHYLAGGDTIEL